MIDRDLLRLARLHGVLPAYEDGFNRRREVSPEAVVAVLRELGAEIDRPGDAGAAARAESRRRWSELAPDAAVVWQGRPKSLTLRAATAASPTRLECRLTLDSGEERRWELVWDALPCAARPGIDGERFEARRLKLPADLPLGYHRLAVETGDHVAETFLISAPQRCFETPAHRRYWGVFLPLYALHTERSWGAGDFSDLGELIDWTQELGGSLVGVLPMLAAFLDEPFEYSPYVPASRLFWNEFYADPRRAPEWERSAAAREIADSVEGRALIADLRAGELVDYRRQAALKRDVFQALAAESDPAELAAYAAERPELTAYARFRATTETRGETWQDWPERLRSGRLEPGDYDLAAERRHLYVQRLADAQIADLAARSGAGGLYLDLPLGVHSGGFDVWRRPDSFAFGVAGGAPPDRFFTKGQNWSFAPLHPEAMRRDGYRYWIGCLRHHLTHSAALRVDHFMGLHRLFWVPRGMEADQGAYVQYPAEEMYAVVCLESVRRRARIIGEDLGTVPKHVRVRMAEHGIGRTYVAQFSFRPRLEPAPPGSFAVVNTHDTPTFAAFWQGLDIDDRLQMRLINEQEAADERAARERFRWEVARSFGVEPNAEAVLEACLREMAEGPAEGVLATLEDLWGETQPQNTPGTGSERPNWRRRARLSLEQMRESTEVRRFLDILAEIRPQKETAR